MTASRNPFEIARAHLIRRLVAILVIAIGVRYLVPGLS